MNRITTGHARLAAAIVGASLLAPAVLADTTISRAPIPTSADGTVEVNNVIGDIDVVGHDGDVVELQGELGEDVEELIFRRDGDVVLVHVENGTTRTGRGDHEARLELRVPRGNRVVVDAVSGDVRIAEVDGALRISTVSGDIEASGAGSELEMRTMSGDVDFAGRDQSGVARLSSVSGDVEMFGFGGEVISDSVSGDVFMRLLPISRLELRSTSGDVEAAFVLAADARVDIESVSGEVALAIGESTDGVYEVRSFSGEVDVCFGPEPERPRFGPGSRLYFTQGEGGPKVFVNSMSGSVRICD